MRDLNDFFSHVHVITLQRRQDRLDRLCRNLRRHDWPFKWPRVFHAIDGKIVGCPPEYRAGAGAFGCRESHCSILREHVMNREDGWVLVLEDDAEIGATFSEDVAGFLDLVEQHAPDADGLMLGGHHQEPPKAIVPGLVKVMSSTSTHAYACRRQYLRALYHRWSTTVHEHIDWRMRGWQSFQHVYAPQPWLVWQARGLSDISSAIDPRERWKPPTGKEPVILLHAPQPVVAELRQFGLHTGYNRHAQTDVDCRLDECFALGIDPARRARRLSNWIKSVQGECTGKEPLVCTIWHPACTREQAASATEAKIIEVRADSARRALAQIPAGVLPSWVRDTAMPEASASREVEITNARLC